jgi:intein/homing endonuclease
MKLPSKLCPFLSEEVGLHIGDGSMNFYNNKGLYQLRGHFLDDRKHYDLRIKELYKKIYSIDVSLRLMKSTGVYGFQIWSNKLVSFKQKLGLPLGKKMNIKIPNQFLDEEILLIPVIRGIFDTDGCLYLEKKNKKLYPRAKFTTTSGILANQIKNSLSKLSILSTKYTYIRPEKNWNDLHSVEIRGDKRVENFFQIIQPANYKHNMKYRSYKKNL